MRGAIPEPHRAAYKTKFLFSFFLLTSVCIGSCLVWPGQRANSVSLPIGLFSPASYREHAQDLQACVRIDMPITVDSLSWDEQRPHEFDLNFRRYRDEVMRHDLSPDINSCPS